MSLWDYNYYIGKKIGKYLIKEVLGVGGMGVVYKAEHIYLNTQVAIKLLLPDEKGEEWNKRFLREARLLAELKHPNIVEIYDFDFTEEGYPYYVMELLEGLSLKDYLVENGKPDFERFKEICIQVGEALFYAHSKGIVHRDLKPSNIFLTWENNNLKVKILDFGIAKLITKREDTMTLTKTTDFLGTPYYIAPEQVLNQNIGAHTDIYSFGLIAAEMLLGKPVRDEKSLGEILGVEIRKPVDLSKIEGIPISVARAIFIATMPDPADRFKDVKAFINAMFDKTPTDIDSFDFDDRTRTLKHAFYLQEESKTLKISQKGYPKILLFLAAVVLLGVLFVFFFKKKHPIIKPAPKRRLVLLKKQFEVPPDSSFFLGSTEEALFLATIDSIYSIPFNGRGKLWLTDVVHKEDIVGFDRKGNIFVKNGDSVYKEFLPKKEKKLFIKKTPQLDILKVCYSGKFIAGAKKNVLKLYSIKDRKAVEVFSEKLSFSPSNLVLNDNYIFVYTFNAFAGFSVKNGREILEKKLDEIVGTPVAAIQQHGNYVAYGGWSDSVFLINLQTKSIKHLVFSGKTTSLLFIPDTKTPLIIKENKIGIYRGGKIFELPIQDSLLHHVEVIPGGFALLDVLSHRVLFVSYSDVVPVKKIDISSIDLWSMAYYKDKVFAGARDGKLFEINTKSFKAKEVFKHNEGLTSILVLNNFLITASDDRTIGVFSLPDVRLKMRTKAHTYLINYLFADNDNANAFWSSSSDGTIKKWLLPDLIQKDVIKSGKSHHFAAFNIVNNLLIAGTWDKALKVYEKQNEVWKLKKEFSLNSVAVYTMCYLKSLNLVVASGIESFYLYLLDLDDFSLYSIPEGNYNSWLVNSGKNECMVFANGIINKFKFEKKGKSIYYTKYSLINTDTSIITTGTITNKFIVAGNTKGQVFFFDKSKLSFQIEEKSKAEKIF